MHSLEIINKKSLTKANRSKQPKISQYLPVYDMSLIGALESDHIQILDLYNKILTSAKNEKYLSMQLSLVEFATSFTDHIQIEDEKLYGYLKILAKNKSHLEQKIVAGFHSEMKNISISVFSFLSQSPHIPVNENNVDNFIAEFEQIGLLLQDRIKREEMILYPIYKNSRKVVNISQ